MAGENNLTPGGSWGYFVLVLFGFLKYNGVKKAERQIGVE